VKAFLSREDNRDWVDLKFPIRVEEETNEKFEDVEVYCKICRLFPGGVVTWGEKGNKPRLPGPFVKYQAKILLTGKYTGSLNWKQFITHRKLPFHIWAMDNFHGVGKRQRVIPFSFVKKKQKISQKDQELFDQTVCLILSMRPLSDIVLWKQLQEYRGRDVKGTYAGALRILESLWEWMKIEHDELLSKTHVHALNIDDSVFHNRELQTLVFSCDSSNDSQTTATHSFMFGLTQLFHDEISSEGMLKVLTEQAGIDWDKVFFFGTDKASVMVLLGEMLVEFQNGYLICIFCNNHGCQLLLKEMLLGVPCMCLLIDNLDDLNWLFRNSAKSYSFLLSKLLSSTYYHDRGNAGARILQRIKDLPRWTGVVDASSAMLDLYDSILLALFEIFAAPDTTAEQKHRCQAHIRYWCNYTSLVALVVMNFVGKFFVRFHKKLQSRETDISTLFDEIQILSLSVRSCLDGAQLREVVKSIRAVYDRVRKAKNLAKWEKSHDVFERFSDEYEDKHFEAEVHRILTLLEQLYTENLSDKFPAASLNILKAFDELFNPKNFPQFPENLTDEKEREILSKFCKRKAVSILCDFYGKPKVLSTCQKSNSTN
jgi:hypothetical protein